jgi:hypothetical protein
MPNSYHNRRDWSRAAWPRPAIELALDVPRLEQALGQIAEEFGTDRSDICAARLIELWVWFVVAAAAEPLLRSGRLPDLSPARTLLTLDGPSAEWTVQLGAQAAADEETLVALLSRSLADQLEPLVETLNAITGRPRRALWRSATDRVAGAILWVGDEVGQPERAAGLARRAVSVAPLRGRALVELVTLPTGSVERLQVRDGCCLYYRVPGGEPCSSCPLVPAEERGGRLAAELAL